MKTILVVFTKERLGKDSDTSKMKKYAYNTEADLKEGDLIISNSYNSFLQVTNVLETLYTYYNSVTGEMSNEITSSNQWKIKTLILNQENNPNFVYGSLAHL